MRALRSEMEYLVIKSFMGVSTARSAFMRARRAGERGRGILGCWMGESGRG